MADEATKVAAETAPPPEVHSEEAPSKTSGPSKDWEKFRKEQQKRGQDQALRDVEAKAKKLGFASVEEMWAYLEEEEDGAEKDERAAAPPAPPPTASPAALSSRSQKRAERESRKKWETEKEQHIREKTELEGKLKAEAAARGLAEDASETEKVHRSLERIVTKMGCVDPEYAVELLSRHVTGMTEAEADKVDESAFFEGLKTSHPHLFSQAGKSATTGTGTGNGGAAPLKPGEALKATGDAGKFDFTKASREEVNARLEKIGLKSRF